MVRQLTEDEIIELLKKPELFIQKPIVRYEDKSIFVEFRDSKNNHIVGYIFNLYDITKKVD